jgi:hypothetical protein
VAERKYSEIEIKPDRWEEPDVLGLAFVSSQGNSINVVRCTEDDLEALYNLLERYFDSQPSGEGAIPAVISRPLEWHEGTHPWETHDGLPRHQHSLNGALTISPHSSQVHFKGGLPFD